MSFIGEKTLQHSYEKYYNTKKKGCWCLPAILALCAHERADDVSCLHEPGAQRYANAYVDRLVGKSIKMFVVSFLIGQRCIAPSPSTEYINTFRPLNIMIAIGMWRDFQSLNSIQTSRIFRFRRCFCTVDVMMGPFTLCLYLLFYIFLLSLFTRITSALFIYNKRTLLDIGHRCTNLLQDTLSTDPAWPLEILRNTEVNKGHLIKRRKERNTAGDVLESATDWGKGLTVLLYWVFCSLMSKPWRIRWTILEPG